MAVLLVMGEAMDAEQALKIEIDDTSGHVVGGVLMHGNTPICSHPESGAVFHYPTYDRELYALVN